MILIVVSSRCRVPDLLGFHTCRKDVELGIHFFFCFRRAPRGRGTCVASPTPTKRKTKFEHFHQNIIETGVWSKSSPHKACYNSHHSACVLPTEAPGRHRTQTLTQASPAVAYCKSEARLAMGFLLIDNSGPAAAESEFAASAMRQLRRPIGLCSRQMSQWKTTTKSRRTQPICSHIAKKHFAGWCIFRSTLQLPQSV